MLAVRLHADLSVLTEEALTAIAQNPSSIRGRGDRLSITYRSLVKHFGGPCAIMAVEEAIAEIEASQLLL